MDMRLISPYMKSTLEIIKSMSGIEVTAVEEPEEENGDFKSYGVASVINFVGKIKGRFLIDMEPSLALKIVNNMTGEEITDMSDRTLTAGISEMNNIIAGDANTRLNNEYGLGLRLAPPIVFSGKDVIIYATKMDAYTINCNTEFGAFKINVAFLGGLE